MYNTCISFYLKAYRIHVYIDTLRALGSPSRICFMLDNEVSNMAIVSYNKRDFRSHKVSGDVYSGNHSLEISSFPLCKLVAARHKWDINRSYRIIGKVETIENGQKAVVFNLEKAEIIKDANL